MFWLDIYPIIHIVSLCNVSLANDDIDSLHQKRPSPYKPMV